MSSSSSDDESKPPTAFAKQLFDMLDNDRQPVSRSSKYTAFWLEHGLPLSSQYRLSEANGVLNHWELAFKDPSESHPAGEYICGACEAAAKRDWDPCEEYRKARDRRDQEEWQDDEEGSGTEEEGAEDEEENSEQEEAGAEEEGSEEEELESWEGVADVTHLREHAATRKHILNMQFSRRASKNFFIAMFLVNIRVMTQAFQDYLNNCVWMGGEFGFPFADETVSLLQDLQLGNAGVAQVVARHEATSKRQAEHGWDFENYDSDFIYSDIAEKEQWYPFQRAAKKVPKPKCAACWGHHPLNLCCCCTQGIKERRSAFSVNTKLGTCPKRICRAAVQKTGRCQWTYSFEAECLLFALPQPAHRDIFQLCKGVIGDLLPDVQPGQPSDHTPEDALVITNKMGATIKARPAFADMFLKVNDKLAFMKRVKPYMWVGMEGGIRSSFCRGVPLGPLGTCASCQQLQTVISSGIPAGSAA